MSQIYYDKLLQMSAAKFDNLVKYIEGDESGFLSADPLQKDRLKFYIGLLEMVLILEISLTDNEEKFTLKTYKLVDNLNDYGKKIAEHIPALDITGSYTTHTQFTTEKITKGDFGREFDHTILRDFGKDYINEVLNTLSISKN